MRRMSRRAASEETPPELDVQLINHRLTIFLVFRFLAGDAFGRLRLAAVLDVLEVG